MHKATVYLTAVLMALLLKGVTAHGGQEQPIRQRPAGGAIDELLETLEKMRQTSLEIAADQQKGSIEGIFKQAAAHVRHAQEQLEKLEAQRRQHMEQLRKDLEKLRGQLLEVLTEEQREKLREKAGQFGVILSGGRSAGPAQRLEEAIERLNLSEQQRDRLRKVRREAQERLEQVRQKFQNDQQGMAEATRQLMREIREEVEELLTPQQRQELREMLRAQPAQRER